MKAKRLILTKHEAVAAAKGELRQVRRAVELPHFRPSDTKGYDWTWRGQAPIKSARQQARYPGGCWQDVRHARLLELAPLGIPGDRVWGAETFDVWRLGAGEHAHEGERYESPLNPPWETDENHLHPKDAGLAVYYAATDGRDYPWRSSTQMPRWASRHEWTIAKVRAERAWSVTIDDLDLLGVDLENDDIAAGGFTDAERAVMAGGGLRHEPEIYGYAALWDAAHARTRAQYESLRWELNPWQWVYDFAVNEAEEGGR